MQFKRSLALLLGASALVFTGACSSSSGDGDGDAGSSKATSPSAGAPAKLASADLQSRWWSWTDADPEGANPIDDRDGRLCGKNQATDVWFLAGTHGGPAKRACRVPTGVPIAFPLVNRVATKSECDAFLRTAKGSATLDGKALEPERLGAAPVKGMGPGALSCGLWVQTAPLPAGTHTLRFEGSSGSFSTAVDYRLEAAPR
ncbi:signal protein [Streptomyces sp. I05A-00742]|uniref:signal protein n=1 Tax=Streptomyces sp. I05A-00742 TaxID=2732853 RepID=UPI001489CB8F|nr:signal protein [Streptomyces sp. I05A-00742]